MAEPPRFLLLLPPAPSPPTFSSLKTAFGDTVSQVLKEVASHAPDSPKAPILEVALALPELAGAQQRPRAEVYGSVQAAVAGIYRLVCVIAARDNLDVEDEDGVDVRILLIAWSPEAVQTQPRAGPYGPVVDLDGLARSERPWQYAFGVESDAGEAIVKAFVAAKGRGGDVRTLSESADPASQQSGSAAHEQQASGKWHYHTIVGGTFDHLHIGHKLLLTMTIFAVDEQDRGWGDTAQNERSATIGITGDALLTKKKHAELLQSWPERQAAVQSFVDSLINFSPRPPAITTRDNPGPNGKSVDLHYPNHLAVKCTEIQDPFGPTITEEWLNALIISAETRSGGNAVNEKRKEKQWKELEVFEVDVLDTTDKEGSPKTETDGFEEKLSSTAIRQKLARKDGGV